MYKKQRGGIFVRKKTICTVVLVAMICVINVFRLTPNQTIVFASVNKVKGSEVLIIGDSFLALSHDITKRLEQNAKNAGVLDASDRFRDNSVSGTMLNGGTSPTIPDQYKNGLKSGAVKYVIMDGGGNDSIFGDPTGAANSFKNLIKQMEKDGVIKVFYLFYPDPLQDMNGLKGKLDTLRPIIKNTVESSVKPKGYFLDLRPVFEGKYSQYILSDGIHPTTAGSNAAADAIWKEMEKNDFFDTKTNTDPITDTIIYGDSNGDGKVDSLDVAAYKKYLMTPQSTYNKVMDVNIDNSIDALDFAIVKKYLLGTISALPYI